MWSPLGFLAPRRVAARAREIGVVEDQQGRVRTAVVRFGDRCATVGDVGDAREEGASAPGALLDEVALGGRRPVVVVTADALPFLDEAAPDRRVGARPASPAALRWLDAARRRGVDLLGVYPLLGSALAGVRVASEDPPGLLLQVERTGTALLEHVRARCRDVEHVAHAEPSLETCLRLLGVGCPLALLCGGGTDLSRLGFELVDAGTTWIRLAPLDARVECDADPASLAAVVGAARHAAGLAPADAVAPIAPPAA